MDIKRKERLELLKKKNKEVQAKKKVEENILLNECITALASNANILKKEEAEKIYKIFKEKIPFLPWGVDWKQFKSFQTIESFKKINEICVNKDFYIIWDVTLPIIKSDLLSIIRCIDDISVVEPDTWLFSLNYNEVVEVYHEGKITVGIICEEY